MPPLDLCRGPCVMLVEHDAIVAMLVEQILLDMGLRVLVVSTRTMP